MKLRKRYLPLVGLLGAATAVLPSMASSAAAPTATVSGTESIMWSPMEVSISPGGTVTFVDKSKSVPHGVKWVSGPETPACSGVPIDEGKTHWEGTCTFVREGTYHYYCSVHGPQMSGTIIVGSGVSTETTGGTTSSTTTGTSTEAPQQTSATLPATNTTPASQGAPMSMTAPQSTPGAASPRDSLSDAVLRLARRQHGSVRGSVLVAQPGSKLVVELLVPAAALGGPRGRGAEELVGRASKAGLAAGRAPLRVTLDGRARTALERDGKLAVTVKIFLTPPMAGRITRTIRVALLK